MKDVDDHTIKMNLASAQKILGISDEVHSLLVILDDTRNTDSVKETLDARLRAEGFSLESITWEEQGRFYRHAKALLDKIYHVIAAIISVVIFFSIANTVNMSLFERIQEFGTMMAIGNRRSVIFTTILFETAFLGVIGAIIGILIGCGVAAFVSYIGIEMPPPPQGGGSYYAMIALTPGLLIITFGVALVSTMLSSILPSYRVSRMRIVEALGYE
jgi:putative ABC transport system permease protein